MDGIFMKKAAFEVGTPIISRHHFYSTFLVLTKCAARRESNPHHCTILIAGEDWLLKMGKKFGLRKKVGYVKDCDHEEDFVMKRPETGDCPSCRKYCQWNYCRWGMLGLTQ